MLKTSYRRISINNLTRTDRGRIEEFLKSSGQSTIFHTIEWNSILSDTLLKPMDSISLILAERNDELCGFFPIIIQYLKFMIQGAFSPQRGYETAYGGPVYEDEDILHGLLKEAERPLSIQLLDITIPPGYDPTHIKFHGYENRKEETVILDLNKNENDLLKGMKKTVRKNIRKAEKNNLEVIDCKYPSDHEIDTFHDFMQVTMKDAAKKVQFYKMVLKELIPKKMAQFHLVKHEGEIIAGSIYLVFRGIFYIWNSKTNRDFRSMVPNYLLQWEIIKRAKESGHSKFDFVRIDREALPEISAFKMSWGGEVVEYHRLKKKKKTLRLLRSFKD